MHTAYIKLQYLLLYFKTSFLIQERHMASCFYKITAVKSAENFLNVCTGLLSLALFAVLESVCQGVQCHVSIRLLAVVSHQSDPHHLMKTEVESTGYQSLQ